MTNNGQPTAGATQARPRLRTIKVPARNEEFRIVQLVGNLFVCSRANGNCCCGWEEKGRMPFQNDLWGDEWEQRKIRNRVHLTFTGCLGPCATGNNALLVLYGQAIWMKDLNDERLVPQVYDYIQEMLAVGRVLPPPEALRPHMFERWWWETADQEKAAASEDDGLDGLDPVCLMEVDPVTARHRTEYQGRTIVFCAPSCRKMFLAEPEAYLAG